MKEKKLLNALNDIDERYIADAAPGKHRVSKRPLYKRLIKAAVLVLVATGAIFGAKSLFKDPGSMEVATEAHLPETKAAMTEAGIEIRTEAAAEPRETIWEETAAPEAANADDPSITLGQPLREQYPGFGLPENCIRLEASAGEDETPYFISDPESIRRIFELLADCLCTDDVDLSVAEGYPMTILIHFEDGSSTYIELYRHSFSFTGYYYEISDEQQAALQEYLKP